MKSFERGQRRFSRRRANLEIVTLVALAVAVGCKDSGKSQGARPAASLAARPETKPSAGLTGLEVAVDARVELFSIIFRLAGAPEYGRSVVTPYSVAVDEHFGKFADHSAVAAARDLRRSNSIGWDAPMTLAVYVDATTFAPSRPLEPLPAGLDQRWQGAKVDAFLAKVQDFAVASGFAEFLTERRMYLGAVEERFRVALAPHDIAGWLSAFFASDRRPTFVVVPGMLTGKMNYHAGSVDEAGSEVSYQIVMLEQVDGDGLPRPSTSSVALVAHEMAHGYVNPVVEAHLGTLSAVAAPIFARVEPAMARAAYPSWKLMTFESLVRASTILFAEARLGSAQTIATLIEDEATGFLWVNDLADHLDERRTERGGRDFSADIPAVVEFFAALEESYQRGGLPRPRFRGPIGAALNPQGVRRLAILAPQGGELATYVTEIRKMLKADGPMLGHAEVDWPKLSGRPVLLYGTPSTSPVVAEFLAAAAIEVSADKIVIDGRAFPGTDLVVIACRPHPGDPSQGAVIYAAHDETALIGVNSLRHGPTDWVVGRRSGKQIGAVASGHFEKSRAGSWTSRP